LVFEPYVAIDLETTGLDPRKDSILDCFLSYDGDTYETLPLANLAEIANIAKGRRLLFHNGKFDLHFLYHRGINLVNSNWRDTLLLHHLLDENLQHDLDFLIKRYFKDDYKEKFWAKYKTYDEAPIDEKRDYGGKDVMYTYRLYHALQEALQIDGIPPSLIQHVHRLATSLLQTEIEGIAVDLQYLQEKGIALKTRINRLQTDMRNLVETEVETIEMDLWMAELSKRKTEKGKSNVRRPVFSFDSSKQLSTLLYDILKLPLQRNDKTKSVTTDDAALQKLEDRHEVLPLIREYREIQKIYGTYVEGILERQVDSRVYPGFNVAGTTTGRISHSNPNLGNMPAEGGLRGMFLASPGYKLISADYSQLEICLAAHFSQDKNLLDIVLNGKSQHDITAQSLEIPRQKAKTLNFAAQYGCSAFKISKILSTSIKNAEELYTKYWDTYNGQKKLIGECNAKVDAGQAIVSPFGRKRRFEKKTKRPPWDSAYRQSYNALIQGTGADLTSKSYYIISEELREKKDGRGLWTVHDEVLIEVRSDKVDYYRRRLQEIMVSLGREIKLTVPLSVEVSEGSDKWED
jgi:DNA polymerase-1